MLLLGLLAIVAPLALGAPECFHEVNRLKEAYAYKFNIANMNENQYMEDLESIIEYELEKTDCSDPNYIEYDQTAVFLNARDKKTLFEDMLIGGNYRAMACKVTYCPRTGKEIVSYAVQTTIIQHNRKIDGPPASKCHETWPVPKGGLCARVEQDTSMMTQRERQ
ncbi:Protein CBG01312 [Caenorhabditis briggsae]|uniref:Protein CBG01312 n=1 Tax=Caenorhabditis briggsae TaxID=6238 RepID=A8WQ41_CAEBR|nr:Protein CBG01312 [Caenorhabditis briggsae]CAP22599.1 Protein CBG01312 [Caenorhabditis briggsae]